MKKLFLSLLIVMFSLVAVNAQTFGVRAGINYNNANIKNASTEYLAGYHFGGDIDFKVSDYIGINTGFIYSRKGTKIEIEDEGIDIKMPLNYFEIPLNIVYKFDVHGVSMFAQTGPYVGYGFSGKMKSGGESVDLEFGSDNPDDIKALDVGLNMGLGAKFKDFKVMANYGFGFNNSSNQDDMNLKIRTISISVTYFIPLKKKK